MLRLHDGAWEHATALGCGRCMAETQHAVRLPNQLPQREHRPEQCRAFCGTVENSPVVQPRVNVVQKSSPASCRTVELPFPSEIKSTRTANDAGLQYKTRQPGASLRAILNPAATRAAPLWDGQANLDKPA